MKGTIVAGSHTEGWVTVRVDRAPTGLRLGDAVDVLFGDDAAPIVRERDEARRERDKAQNREDIAHAQCINLMVRLSRMVRIALRWRQESLKWMREHAEACLDVGIAQSSEERATARAARAETELAKCNEERLAWMRRHVACEKANDSLQAELAELRSLWACDEAERLRAVEAWRKATGSQGDPSVGALLAWAARGEHLFETHAQ